MSASPFEAHADRVRVRVRLTPRGGRDAVEGVEVLADGRTVLKARVRAAPEKGAANAALEKLIAKTCNVPKSAVTLTAGATGRVKTLDIRGEPKAIAARLNAADGNPPKS